MTDFETLKAMLEKAGILYEAKMDKFGGSIEVASGGGPHNKGYSGFATYFGFTGEGALEDMGAWE